MKRVVLAAVGLAALASQAAIAADIPVKAPMMVPVVAPAFDWTGFYIGVAGGGVWGRSRHINSAGDITPNFNVSGGIIGGTLGYNVQSGSWVFGLEADGSWTNKRGSAFDIAPFNTAFSSETRENWLFTGRGRVGYTWNQVLLYATGGAAGADVKITVCGPAPGCASESKTRWGWTAGGGIEVAFSQAWSAKAEYLYVDFGKTSYFNPPPSALFVDRVGGVTLNDHVFRIGLNYHFNAGPVVARY